MTIGVFSNRSVFDALAASIDEGMHALSSGSKVSKDGNKPSFSTDQAATHITRGGFRHYDRNGDKRIEVFFNIDKSFSPIQKDKIRQVLRAWQDVANISFKEGSGQGDGSINIANKPGLSGGESYQPNKHFGNIDTFVGTMGIPAAPPAFSTFGFVAIHELGHAIGLDHPGDYNSIFASYSASAEYAQDTKARSVMSYWDETNQPGHNFEARSPEGPMMDDIAAVQALYGANLSVRKNDTTYGFNSNAERADFSLKSANDKPVFCVWDGGGNDTLDFSGFNKRQVINLRAESFSDVGGLKGNVSIAKGVVLENAVGGSVGDVITGNSANNRIKGGGGADKLTGGEGSDVFVYDKVSDSTVFQPDEILDFTSGTDKIDLSGILKNTKFSDVYIVDRFSGRPGEIVLTHDNRTGQASLSIDLTGNAKADVLINAQGVMRFADLITGKNLNPEKPGPTPSQTDTVYGFHSNTGDPATSLSASSRAPNFTVSDPGGNDTLEFSGFKHDQIIDLRPGSSSSVGGGRNNVAISRGTVIENAIGGSGNDRMIGNIANNTLKGGKGADTYWGVGGANTYAYDKVSDSTYDQCDVIMDFVSGRDKIDLRVMIKDANTTFRFVNAYTGRIGDTIVKFNPQSGKYFVGVDMTGNRQTDFLVKSARPLKPEDLIGLGA